MTSNAHENVYDSFGGMYGQPSSPTHFGATVGSPDINSLLEAFTNNGSYQAADEYGGTSQNHQSQSIQSVGGHVNMNMNMPQSTGSSSGMGFFQDRPSSSSSGSLCMGYSGGEALQFADGLRIHPAHYQQPVSQASYYTEQPNAGTVTRLEEAAMQPSGPFQSAYLRQSQASVPGRQSRRSTFSDGVSNIAALSLNSPRHSASTGSTTSSSQNSPTTPISAYSLDPSASFAYMQQQHSQQYNPNALAQSVGSGKMQFQQSQYSNPLSASLPPSLGQQHPGYPMQTSFSQQGPAPPNMLSRSLAPGNLSQSQNRMPNAGLMDRVMSSRAAEAEPFQPPQETTKKSEKKGVERRTRSKTSLTSSPPLTPSRASSLRSSRGLASSQSTPQGLGTSGAEKQTPSRAGPHRTPGKTPASGTPKRPDTLRRTASHNPHGSTLLGNGLASPANVDSFRAQQAQQAGGQSSLDTAKLRRVGSGLEFEFPKRPPAMVRAISSPGWASIPPPPSRSSDSEYSDASGRSRRSSTILSLQMSPTSGPGTFAPLLSPPSMNPLSPLASCQQALQALNYLSAFLAERAVELQANPQQMAGLALGTYEQSHAVEDLKRRIQMRLSA